MSLLKLFDFVIHLIVDVLWELDCRVTAVYEGDVVLRINLSIADECLCDFERPLGVASVGEHEQLAVVCLACVEGSEADRGPLLDMGVVVQGHYVV